MLAQLCQINLVTQGRAERRYRASRIILAAIEAAVDDGLNAMTKGLEEGRNDQGGDHNGSTVIGVDDAAQEGLQPDDAAKVYQDQYGCERAIHQRAVDQQVDVVEPIAQNREPDGERGQKQGGWPKGKSNKKTTECI